MLLLFNYMKMYLSVSKHNNLPWKEAAINKNRWASSTIYHQRASAAAEPARSSATAEAQDFSDPGAT